MQTMRVKLVDLGGQRIANVSDVGYLDECFTAFPKQSINVGLLNLVPWNARSWNDDDKMYVTKLLAENRTDEPEVRYEMNVHFDMEPNVIFSSKLCSTGFDYAETIVSKGIARHGKSNDFFQHVKELKHQL